jgi:hypothetical protein
LGGRSSPPPRLGLRVQPLASLCSVVQTVALREGTCWEGAVLGGGVMEASRPGIPPQEAAEERRVHEATERRAEREAVEERKAAEAAERDAAQEAVSERGAVTQGVTEGGAANTAAEALTEGGAANTAARGAHEIAAAPKNVAGEAADVPKKVSGDVADTGKKVSGDVADTAKSAFDRDEPSDREQ